MNNEQEPECGEMPPYIIAPDETLPSVVIPWNTKERGPPPYSRIGLFQEDLDGNLINLELVPQVYYRDAESQAELREGLQLAWESLASDARPDVRVAAFAVVYGSAKRQKIKPAE